MVDAAYDCPDGSVLIAESDGRLGHFEVDGWWKDMQRDNEDTVDRLGTLRFPGFVLLTHPHEVAATIAAASENARFGELILVAGGSRRLRYRGTIKNNAWLHYRTAALNLRPPAHPRPEPPHNGTWAIAAG